MVARLKLVRPLAVPAATWLAWLLPVFAWAPLTYPGYFEFRSGFAPIFNLSSLAAHPAVGWAAVAGRPYGLLRGEGALPYVLALLPRSIGVSSVASIKL